MATALSFRPSATALNEREASLSSLTGLPNSSTLANTTSHHKLSSQTSLVSQSPLPLNGKSSRPASGTHQDGAPRRRKRLKSQYPLDSREPHAEYILVASFDIDRGPIMEHQYPGAISPDENMLAELMLPDQTHVRTQDWTMFFLHKDASAEEQEVAEKQARRERRREKRADKENALLNGQPLEEGEYSDDTDSGDDEEGREGPPLMYVLNLVNTKQDNTVKRSAAPIRRRR
jgi:Docking domain of Afi1 for Arf3 in vesicle trafficking